MREHFGTEEPLMVQHHYPFLAQHQREHRSFVEHFNRLRAEIESGHHEHPFLVFLVQIFLIDWFANHSTQIDRHLARYLRRVGAGGAAPVPGSGNSQQPMAWPRPRPR